MDRGVRCKFGMKRRYQDAALSRQYGLALRGGEDLHIRTGAVDDRRTDEHHLQGRGRQFCGFMADIAEDLAAVCVANHRNVGEPERRLRRVAHLLRQQNRTSASREDRSAARGVLTQSCVEAFLGEELPLRRAFAAGKNHCVHAIEVAARANKHVLDAQPQQHGSVSLKVSLDGKNSNFHVLLNISSIRIPYRLDKMTTACHPERSEGFAFRALEKQQIPRLKTERSE